MNIFIFGEIIIKILSNFQPIGQPIRKDGPSNHIIKKAGTPTMGGILILSSITISLFLWGDLSNKFVWICFIATISFGYNYPEIINANHACGPGNTFNYISRYVDKSNINIFLSYEDALNTLMRSGDKK